MYMCLYINEYRYILYIYIYIYIYIINKYILVFIYIYLIAWVFICDPGFHAALLQQSSDKEENIWEIKKIEKYGQVNVYIVICILAFITSDLDCFFDIIDLLCEWVVRKKQLKD